MRIESVRIIRAELVRTDPTWRTALYADSAMAGFVLEIIADGVVGLGATSGHPLQIVDDALEVQLRTLVTPALVGADPLRGSAIRADLRSRGVHRRAFLAADLALHDLIGKVAGLPCHVLWGGPVHPAVEVVRMIGLKSPEEVVEAGLELTAEGVTHLKIKIGGSFEEDLRRVAMLRDHVGPAVWLGVDGNGAYERDGALRLARAMVRHDVRLFEQPLPAGDLDGQRAVTAASPIPIMADQGVVDVATALEVCQRRAAHMIAIKITKMGSIDACRRIAELCAAFGVGVHIGGSAAPALVDVAQAHLAIACAEIAPECEVGEFQAVTGDPTRGAIIRDGQLVVAAAPGFGMTLDPALSESHQERRA